MIGYKQLKNVNGKINTTEIQRLSDNAVIPFDEANTDYQEYIAWTKASPKNVAEPADE